MTDIILSEEDRQMKAEKDHLEKMKKELMSKRSKLQDERYLIENKIIKLNWKIKMYIDILKHKYGVQCIHSYSMYGVCLQCGKKNELDRDGNWENKDEGDI